MSDESGGGPTVSPDSSTAAAITAVWRMEAPHLLAALVRQTRDLDLAEDSVQDALVDALQQWPHAGIPNNPGAWLMTVAKRRGIDHIRRAQAHRQRLATMGQEFQEPVMNDLSATVDRVEDDVLRLLFIACHPCLAPVSRAALTLRLVGGLTTTEIARAYLVPQATMAQRISRAKRTLSDTGALIEDPGPKERVKRLDDVMAVCYLIFNEGYRATAGVDVTRPDLCHEAIRLARLLAGLAPRDPEVHGLQALLELQASRLPARTDDAGQVVLLHEQDRGRWDRLLIHRGLAALTRAHHLGHPVGSYTLQAAIAACHARANKPQDTDWLRIAELYDALAQSGDNPVIQLNRAVAHGRAHGADAGLDILAEVADDPALARTAHLAAVRADLLLLGDHRQEAALEFERAARLSGNKAEAALLTRRAKQARG